MVRFYQTPSPLYRAIELPVKYFLKDMTVEELRKPTALNEIMRVLNRRYIQPTENRTSEYRRDYDRLIRPSGFPMEQYVIHLEFLKVRYLKYIKQK